MNKGKIIIPLAAAALTAIMVYLATGLLLSDAMVAVIPGWHTTVYPPYTTRTMLTLSILVVAAVVYGLFRLATRFLTVVWATFQR